jgi:hypothetical protein
MQQAKFSLTVSLIEFLNTYEFYGFKDKSSMVRAAFLRLKEELELQSLKQPANLYAEIYEQDSELQELTDVAVVGWPA